MEKSFTSVTLLKTTKDRLDKVVERHGMKVYTAADFCVRVAEIAPPDIVSQALACGDGAVTTIGGGDCNPCDEGLDLASDVATYNRLVKKFYANGVIEPAERKALAPITKRMERRVVNIGKGVENATGKRSRGKGRAS